MQQNSIHDKAGERLLLITAETRSPLSNINIRYRKKRTQMGPFAFYRLEKYKVLEEQGAGTIIRN